MLLTVAVPNTKLFWEEPLPRVGIDAGRKLKVPFREKVEARLGSAERKHICLHRSIHVTRVQEDQVIALLGVVMLIEQADALFQLFQHALSIAAVPLALGEVHDGTDGRRKASGG